jgi:hypothetical protein
MPYSIEIMGQTLCQYLRLFCDCFSRPQWLHFVRALLALMQPERQRALSDLLHLHSPGYAGDDSRPTDTPS